MYDEVSLQSGLEEGELGRDAGVVALTMFALFEAGNQGQLDQSHPRLRRYAPHLGLTMLAPFGDLSVTRDNSH